MNEVWKDDDETSGGIKLLFPKSTKGVARFIVLIQRANHYQQCICLHIIFTNERFIGLTQVYLEQKLVYDVVLQHPL